MVKVKQAALILSSGSKSSITQEIATAIETVHNFCVFYKAMLLQSLWNGNFFELRDNGLWGCSQVVYFFLAKMGPFLGHLCAARCILIGWWGRS